MTDQELKDLVASLAIGQAKTDEQLAENAIQIAELKVSQAEMAEQIKTSQAESAKQMQTTDSTDQLINQLLNEHPKIEESTKHRYGRCFAKTLEEQGYITIDGINYDEVVINLEKKTKKLKGQYDIGLFNKKFIILIDVKRTASIDNIAKLLKHKITFPKLFQEYKNFSIYLGLASENFHDDLITEAKEHNIYLFQEQAGQIELLQD